MLFSSTVFIFIFLPVVLILYYLPLFRKNNLIYKNIILLFSSIAFYAWGEPLFVFVMLVWVAINWILGLLIETRNHKKVFLSLAVLMDLSLLFVFKYLTFLLENVNHIFWNDKNVIQPIALPIGISFFIFQLMSYIYDVYYSRSRAQKNILSLTLYVSMFPQLIAGPIVRYNDIEGEIKNRSIKWDDVSYGINRFIIGLGKKVILSNNLAIIADRAFVNSTDGTLSVGLAWLGAIAYTLQIYFDFSGYSDMAIGLGRMFGFHFSENFNYPYVATSVTGFWRRWHISLSSWFRDYVYIPLGGNRVEKSKCIRNLFVVWLLTGIWHGANWTFLVWGLIYFCCLFFEKYVIKARKSGILSRLCTILTVIFCWVIFRSDSVGVALEYIKSMLGLTQAGIFDNDFAFLIKNYAVIILLALVAATPVVKNLYHKFKEKIWMQLGFSIYLIAIFLICISYILRGTYNPFIYYNF